MRESEKALECLFEALAIQEKLKGKDHEDSLWTLNTIGIAYDDMGNYQEAQKYWNKVKEIEDKSKK